MAAMLTIYEAAQALGVKPATIRSWIWKRQIEYVKVSRAVRIPRGEIQRLIAAGTRPVVAKATTLPSGANPDRVLQLVRRGAHLRSTEPKEE